MRIRKEWLCDDNGDIVYKPLSFWAEYFGLKPFEHDPNECFWKAEANDKEVRFRYAVLVEIGGGYVMAHDEYDKYKDELFFVANADIGWPKLRLKSR